jgi:hypothetical protein
MALSKPGGVRDAHGSVLPPSIGGKSSGKYLTRILAGLRANVTDEKCLKAIDTLWQLLKIWQKNNAQKALTIVRKCKIGWSTLLLASGPTRVIKGKKGKPDQTVLTSPPKPSKSPWLSAKERSAISDLFKPEWTRLETIREKWVLLEPEEQHTKYSTYQKEIRNLFQELHSISSNVHAKLGKRKHWIEAVCKEDGYKPKPKRDEAVSFLLTSHFFSKDITKLDNRVKKVFAPVSYLDGKTFGVDTTWSNLLPSEKDSRLAEADDFSTEDDGKAYRLWQIWAEQFVPNLPNKSVKLEEAPPVKTTNFFAALLPSLGK